MSSISLKSIITNNLSIIGEGLTVPDLFVGGRIQNSSDARLKEITGTINNSLDKVELLKPVYYRRIDKKEKQEQEIGLIAQEVKEIFPELVTTDSKGYNYIDYSRITAILLQCVKDLNHEIKEMKSQISELKT